MSQMKMEMWHWEHHNRLQRVNKLNGLGMGVGVVVFIVWINWLVWGRENKHMRAAVFSVPSTSREVGMELGTGLITYGEEEHQLHLAMYACRLNNWKLKQKNWVFYNGSVGDLVNFFYFLVPSLSLAGQFDNLPNFFLVVKKNSGLAADTMASFTIADAQPCAAVSRLQDGASSKLGKLLKGINMQRRHGTIRGSII